MAYVKTTYTWTNRRSPPSRLQHGENFKQEKELENKKTINKNKINITPNIEKKIYKNCQYMIIK